MAVNSSRADWKIYNNVFDSFTINLLRKLSSQGYFEELISPIAIGKEANVFTASTKNNSSQVIVKIYRLENSNFNQMLSYLRQDLRYVNLRKNKRDIIFNWVQREYRNLLTSREFISVPKPIAFKNNIIIMELIGEPDNIAPQLKNKFPEQPEIFLNKILDFIKKMWGAGLVHGDLSAFNILNYDEEPVFIDFSQSTTIKSQNSKELLKRDLNNIYSFFKKGNVLFDINLACDEIINQGHNDENYKIH